VKFVSTPILVAELRSLTRIYRGMALDDTGATLRRIGDAVMLVIRVKWAESDAEAGVE